jgi:hypothetical protein
MLNMQVFVGPTQLPTTYAARAARRHGECHGPLGAAHAEPEIRAEPDNLRTLTAVNDTVAQRADSAGSIWLSR